METAASHGPYSKGLREKRTAMVTHESRGANSTISCQIAFGNSRNFNPKSRAKNGQQDYLFYASPAVPENFVLSRVPKKQPDPVQEILYDAPPGESGFVRNGKPPLGNWELKLEPGMDGNRQIRFALGCRREL